MSDKDWKWHLGYLPYDRLRELNSPSYGGSFSDKAGFDLKFPTTVIPTPSKDFNIKTLAQRWEERVQIQEENLLKEYFKKVHKLDLHDLIKRFNNVKLSPDFMKVTYGAGHTEFSYKGQVFLIKTFNLYQGLAFTKKGDW
ncbi:hypothetical protein NVP1121O_241 [Vibrio phage 1.121.O._10N.286.46.C4]|nr:hypothetical protein NVP1121O_241 [Vibrio phage 1.121.O._10N.286.46.C4]